jgi:hypothetical protein
MKIRSLLYLLVLALPLLSGEYKADEAADVTIGDGGVTTIGFTDEAYAVVEPGTYTVIGRSHVVKGTWTHSTTVEEGQTKTVLLPCDKATLIVKPDILWAGEVSRFEVIVTGTLGEYKFFVNPEADMRIAVYKEKYGGQVAALINHDFFYQDRFTLTVPYK